MTIADAAWSLDGTNLATLGYAVRALGAEDLPERRGENVLVPGVDGRTLLAKTYEERVLPLALWVDSRGTSGGVRSAAQLASNLFALKALFGADGAHTLARTFGTTTLQSSVEVRTLRIMPGGPYHYDMLAELVMTDPMWYATAATTATTGFSSVPATLSVTNPGTYVARAMTITLTCPASPAASLTNPKIAVGSFWVKYSGVVAAGQSLVITTRPFAATYAGNSVISLITWNESNGALWLELAKGSNTITVTADGISNTPTITVSFYAPYL